MEETYHIISVYDYKGGEFGTNFNLTYKEFISCLEELLHFYEFIYSADKLEDVDIDDILKTETIILEEGLESGDLMDWIIDTRSIYGGGEHYWSLFKCNNNIITEIDLTAEMLENGVRAYINHEEWT